MKKLYMNLPLLLLALMILLPLKKVQAQDTKPLFNTDENGLYLDGFDITTYSEGTPKKGSAKYSYEYKGAKFNFKNQNNKMKFMENPTQYLPKYGGWCAYAMGLNGEKVTVDPKNYKIKDGKVYLFYRTLFSNTLDAWNKDENKLHKKAELNWGKITE